MPIELPTARRRQALAGSESFAEAAAARERVRRMNGDPIHRWITAVAPGRSFVDIGGIGE